MKISKESLWSKDFILYSIMTSLTALVFYLLLITIPVYAVEEFNASQSFAGLAAGIFIIGALIARLFAGKYLERIGRKRLLYSGVSLFVLAMTFYLVVDKLYLLIFLRFVHGAFNGMTLTVLQTAVLDLIPKNHRGEGISYYSLSIILATAIGPFIGTLISQHADMRMIFVFCIIVSFVSFILSFFASVPELKVDKTELSEAKGFHPKNFFEVKAVPISIVIAVLAFSISSVFTFLTTYSIEINLTSAASFFFVVYSVSILLSRPFTGRFFDTRGENIVIYPSFIALALGFVVLSQADHGFNLLMAGVLIGLGYGNIQSCTQTIAMNVTPPHRVGLATSTFFICVESGMGIGPFLLGYLIPAIGYRKTYLMLAAVVIGCIFLYYFLHGRKRYKKQLSHAELKH